MCWPAAWTEAHQLGQQALEKTRISEVCKAIRRMPCGSWGRVLPAWGASGRGAGQTDYHQALTLATALGMRPLQAHCHLGLGTLYATTGRREQAGAALSTAINLYRAMEMTFWLPQAEAVLAQVEGQ